MMMIKMSDVFINGNGIFANMINPPWDIEMSSSVIDVLYHQTHSAEKWCSPFVTKYLDEDGTLSEESLAGLSNVVLSMYKINWTKLWQAVNQDYDATSNYNITEITSDTEGTTQSGTISYKKNQINESKNTNNDSNNSTINNVASNDNSLYGFNSEDSVKSSSDDGTSTKTETGSNTSSSDGTNKFTADDSDVSNNTKTVTNEHTMTKKGNIGVMTYQSMLKSEIEVRKWNFFEQVFSDVDSILALSIY